jgi:hypothetical protein
MASCTGFPRASGVVWEVEGTVARRLVHGESEGRREAMGHSGVLSRPGLPACASWRAWTFSGRVWARLGPVNADVVLVQGRHGQLQEGQGKSNDMVRGDGCERRKGWHGG